MDNMNGANMPNQRISDVAISNMLQILNSDRLMIMFPQNEQEAMLRTVRQYVYENTRQAQQEIENERSSRLI